MSKFPSFDDSVNTETTNSFFTTPVEQVSSDDGMKMMIEANDVINKYGHWVIYRDYNRDELIDSFDETLQRSDDEGKYVFNDSFIKARKTMQTKGFARDTAVGTSDFDFDIYYLKAENPPKNSDLIIEVTSSTGVNQPKTYHHIQAKKITKVIDLRDFSGEIAYYQVYTKDETPSGDKTLK